MNHLKPKVILITGASSGMGKVTALDLLKQGHIVYGAARRVEQMDEIVKGGGKVIKLDITSEGQIQSAVDQIMSEQGRIDVLWNNAGYAIYGSVEETSMEDAKHQFEVNIFGLARLTQLVIPHMRKEKSGLIINTSSMGGKIYSPLGAWYHATKHALEGWSDCLRIELRQFGINVVIIEPGQVDTEFAEVLLSPMLKRSGEGPYKKMTQTIAKMTQESINKPGSFSPASVISAIVIKAINSKNPKTRYVAGKMAKPLMFIRKWFGDSIYDKILFSMLK